MKVKGLLLSLCIAGLTLLPSYSNAYTYKQDFDIPTTFVKGDVTYMILNNFNVNTTYQGTTMNRILLSKSSYSSNGRNILHSFIAWYNQRIYLYADYLHDGHRDYFYQGHPTQLCIANAGSGESVCVPSGWSCPKNSDYSMFLTAGQLTHGTYYGYGDFNSTYDTWTYCLSDDVYDYCFSINAGGTSTCGGNGYLTGSLNVSGVNLEQLQAINRSTSFFTQGYTPEVQEYSCPTVQQLINTYDEQYNTGLCYSSNLIFSGGTINIVTPKTIFELYPTLKEFRQDVGNYHSYCNYARTNQECETIFENKNENYTLIAKIPNDVNTTKLYEYCNLSLNFEPTQTTCTITGGGMSTGISINDIINEIGEGDYTVITPGRPPEPIITTGNIAGTGSVYDQLKLEDEEYKRRDVIGNGKKIVKTMKELYAKMTGIFRGRSGKNGIIPTYITGILLLIVLFKLFKK